MLMLLIGVLIVVKLISIQLFSGAEWIAIAEKQYNRYLPIKATRGNIYSDNESLLATSLPFYKVAFDPKISTSTKARKEIYEKGIDSLCYKLSAFFKDKSKWQYKNIIDRARLENKEYLRLNSRKINYHEKKNMEKWPIFREGQMNGGVIFEKVEERLKPFKQLARRTIGSINEDNKGAGLEYSFNKELAGINGAAVFTNVGGNIWKPINNTAQKKPIQGNDIKTTIDINLQDVVSYALGKAVQKHQANYGCAVLMEVETGKIKAITNLDRHNDSYIETFNHAVGTGVEPGSTFKLASMMALLEAKDLPLDYKVATGEGEIKYYNSTMTDAKRGGYGTVNLKQVFEKSSNVGISILINKYFGQNVKGHQRFISYIKGFGLGDPLYFQIKGEAIPQIKDPSSSSWSGISLPWISIGYEVKLSPLQILTFYNGVANEGKVMKPYIVKSVNDAHKVIKEYKPTVIKEKLCSYKTLLKLKKMLEGVVENGTAENIKSDHYKIAGKTGTAQKIQNGRYIKKYYSSFVGYFPAEKPKYSCIVVIDNPRGVEKYGGQVAAPVFREIADIIYARDVNLQNIYLDTLNRNLGVFPVVQSGNYRELSYLCNELNVPNNSYDIHNDWVRAQRDDAKNTIKWKKNAIEIKKVPDVVGMTLKDALYILENKGLRVNFKGKGRVRAQSLVPGTKLIVGEKIEIKLS